MAAPRQARDGCARKCCLVQMWMRVCVRLRITGLASTVRGKAMRIKAPSASMPWTPGLILCVYVRVCVCARLCARWHARLPLMCMCLGRVAEHKSLLRCISESASDYAALQAQYEQLQQKIARESGERSAAVGPPSSPSPQHHQAAGTQTEGKDEEVTKGEVEEREAILSAAAQNLQHRELRLDAQEQLAFQVHLCVCVRGCVSLDSQYVLGS